MGIDLWQFAVRRPRLFHLTAAANVDAILEGGLLESARVLMERAADTSYLRQKRKQHLTLRIGERVVHVRDQAPLHAGNMEMEPGTSFEDVIELLNERVFFWPGDERGPIVAGRNHFARYAGEDCKVLVVETEAMLALNPGVQFCRFNSGAPRCSGGRKSPRGAGTFLPPGACEFSAAEVQEVTFVGAARLPRERIRILAATR
ncbi:MAG: hypothetical protein U0573_02720 [Phycisphaerales bacterium]|nr:hypothetical protein [Planctomycetota bacterium]